MPSAKNPNCGEECDNGQLDYYVKSKSRCTIRHERHDCSFCHPEAPNDFRALPDEMEITAEEFFDLRDNYGWEVQTLDDAAFHFRYNLYLPVVHHPATNKPN